MNELLKKLQELGLTVDQVKQLEEGIDALVNEMVELKTDEIQKDMEKLSEQYVAEQVSKELEAQTKTLQESFDQKVVDLESNIVEKLDSFLEMKINESLSEEAIETLAINEIAMPIVEGIKKVFAEQYVELDSEGSNLLKQAKEKLDEQEAKINQLIDENTDLSKVAEAGAIKLLINEKVNGLSDDESEKIRVFCEGKSFDEIETKVDGYVEMVLREKTKEEKKPLNENTDVPTGGDGLKDKENHIPSMYEKANRLAAKM